jgi:hypothetical protein
MEDQMTHLMKSPKQHKLLKTKKKLRKKLSKIYKKDGNSN